jgi:microcystin degradation protein MlrC
VSARIAIAGITHESLGSSPLGTRLDDFRVLRGDELLRDRDGLGQLADELGVEVLPILAATHIAPGGTVELDAYLALRDEIIRGLIALDHLDGVCLLLHGAMLVEHMWSGEADLVRAIRAAIGREVLIAARLDLHANICEDFANRTDIWTAFRTAPHRDATETSRRAVRLLVRAVQSGKRPRPVFVRVPLLLQGEKATTDVEPMRTLEAMAREMEQSAGILNAEVLVGFGWADAPHASSSVAVMAESEADLPRARHHALSLAHSMWRRRDEFTFDQQVVATVDDALDIALAAPEASVWLTDCGDNPTAGTPGDSTFFLKRLLERGIGDAVFASIPDHAAWRSCVSAGAGASVDLELGARWDSTHAGPIAVQGVVEHLFEGNLERGDSPMATVNINGVRVIVTGLRKAMTTLDDFRRAGVDPLRHKIVVVKLGYLMPELRDAAPREIMVLTPGYSDMQLERLPYRFATRPIFPLDRDFAWRPQVTNVAGMTD